MKSAVSLAIVIASLFAAAGLYEARAAERVVTDYAVSTLTPVRDGFAPGEATTFAFAQDLAEGWHVYWKNPGDSGLPLEFRWDLPDGYVAGDIMYPTPERIPVGPLANFGHHGDPVFLASITAPADAQVGDAVNVGLTATWLICEEICVPETGEFALQMVVAASPEENARGAQLAARARAETPRPFDGDAVFYAAPDALVVRAEMDIADIDDALFFPEAEGQIEPSAPQEAALADGAIEIAMAPGYAYAPDELETLDGVLVVTRNGDRQGYEISPTKTDPPADVSPLKITSADVGAAGVNAAGSGISSGGNLAVLLLAAFFGGLILNIMPCVFPIIFIKAAALTQSIHTNDGAVRRHGLLYTAGVVVAFTLIGGALLALRAGGEQLGWGFHLQSPIIVALSAYILLLVGLNLSGVFTFGESLQGVGGSLTAKHGGLGAFFTGALAVLVAAPCIGPLLGAPMAAAIVLPPVAGMLIFIVMALGLAAPYLLLSFAPALGRLLPKPGPWMVTFKQALSFPVFAAAAYFLWVLAQQTNPAGLAATLAGGVILALGVWLFELSKADGRRTIFMRAGSAVALVASIFLITGLEIAEGPAKKATTSYGAVAAVDFDMGAIEEFRAAGRGVFVDFTAAWCVTCQFNKLTIFSKPSLGDLFDETGAVFMVADWTTRDPKITAALEAFGANGVPLYVYFPPTGEPKILPLPLTENAVVKTVRNGSIKETDYAEKS